MPSSPSPTPLPRKRPRPVQSCLHCRGKKLKCDRQQPCGRCAKHNRGSRECIYDEHAGSLGSFSTTRRDTAGTSKQLRKQTGLSESSTASGANERADRDINAPPSIRQLSRTDTATQGQNALVGQQRNLTENGVGHATNIYHGISNTRSLIALVSTSQPSTCRSH